MLKKLLFKIAKGPFMGKIVGFAFQHCSWGIPVKKVYNSKEIFAFYHPKPSYQNHIIISPKRAVKNLQQMAQESFSKYFVKILEIAREICEMHPEYHDSFVLVANGGKRQEVQQVHFHMFTGREIVNEYAAQEQNESVFYNDSDICVLEHPNPKWEVHFVIKSVSFQMTGNESILHSIDLLDDEFNIVQRGYSLVYRYNGEKGEMECPVWHVVSGKKLEA